MSARASRRRGGHEEAHPDERWLVTYADMITLLMALFMVLFSISSVNVSKFKTLQRALQDAFSGKVLPSGKGIKPAGGSDAATTSPAQMPLAALQQTMAGQAGPESSKDEQEGFQRLKRQLDAYAREHGLKAQVRTEITERGLVIRLLTDHVLFESGRAELNPGARPVLGKIGSLVGVDGVHPVQVEGYTDAQAIRSSRFPSNWELSTARASRVVRALIGAGVAQPRLSASGYAALRPIQSNATAAGRARNRRVEIVLLRRNRGQGGPVG